jgi:hypothetical protein
MDTGVTHGELALTAHGQRDGSQQGFDAEIINDVKDRDCRGCRWRHRAKRRNEKAVSKDAIYFDKSHLKGRFNETAEKIGTSKNPRCELAPFFN